MKQRTFWLIIALAVFLLIWVWWLSYGLPRESSLAFRQLNRLFATLGFFFFFLQFLLSSRIKLIEKGFGLDKMILKHRNVGRAALGFLLLHPIFYFLYEGEIVFEGVFIFIGPLVLLGITLTGALASQHRKLHLPYELWLGIHKVNYVLFPLVFVHVFGQAEPGTLLLYFWAAFGTAFIVLMIMKARAELHIRNNPYEVVEVKQEAKDIWSLFFKGRPLDYRPGQFMYLRLKRDGRVSSPHPFTISSSPTRENLAVTPKNLGDFTATVKDTKPGDKALVDAPYGVFSFLNYDCKNILFIAGGIGITPFISMLRYMYDEGIKIPVTLLWANKSEEELCFRDELGKMEEEMGNLKVVYVMSRQKEWKGEKGRIDRKLLEKYTSIPGDYDFFICGPPPMSKAVIAELKDMGVPKNKIHMELFQL